MTFPAQEHLVLKLENIPVSDRAGLATVSVHELAYGGDHKAPSYTQTGFYYGTTLGLVKQTPQVPQNFRADLSLVGTGQNVVLRWDGPDSLTYWIRYPDGALERVDPPVRTTPTPYGPHRHTPRRSLTRGTTYTLMAGTVDGNGQAQEGYFLTTTVHATVPEFDNGVRTPWVEGTANRGRVTFAANGAEVHRPDGGLGTVTADDVTTRVVQGPTDSAGWITFPDRGVNVYHGHDATPGVLTAARVDAEEGVNAPWVGDRAHEKGWIGFTQDGVDVRKNDGGGAIDAYKASLTDLRTDTARVKGLLTLLGGMKVSHDGKGVLETSADGSFVFHHGGSIKGHVVFGYGMFVHLGQASLSMSVKPVPAVGIHGCNLAVGGTVMAGVDSGSTARKL
ncbi:hypothetical protein O1L60_34190 [Streptomyces diastatochromogenes]|nr:hypothetical protein [Streptomyces diastatochromogenes]